MIALQRLNGASFVLNVDLIETLEATPDTVITLINGKKIIVRNGLEDVVRKVVKYKQLCNQSITVLQRTDEDKASTATEPGE
ncbi:MAG: flagellar protein [Chitinivibrionales bacterium]|nr:flagellar protein [Chitinivibrionales bacterium]MBD3358679.1 flagellar protein [Chitinivibrionales bacterium]